MAESYTADAVSIRSLLKDQPLEVPAYQRAFAWKTAQVREFWDDLVEFAGGGPGGKDRYFLGSIVLVERARSSLVLDGQQRLATATMVLAAIRDLLHSEGGAWTREAEDLQKDYIVGKEFQKRRSFRLDLSDQDRELFRRKIQEMGGGSVVLPERFASHKLINAAFRTITKEAKSYRGTGEAGLKNVLKLATVLLDNVSVVRCSSTNYVTAATVFETLNSRGIVLSTSELVRTWTMSRAKSQAERNQIAASWEEILSIHEEANVDDFLRHYWIAKHGDVKGARLYKFIREHKDTKKKDPVFFSRQLEEAAAVYSDLAGAKTRDAIADRSLQAIRIIGAKALYPPLLNLWQKTAESDRKVRRDFTAMLLRLYVRHILIGSRDNSQLEKTVFGIAKHIRTMGLQPALKLSAVDVREIAPDNKNFREEFAEASIASMGAAAYVLRELEQARRPRGEVRVADPDQVHVDHIYPRNPPRSRRLDEHDRVVNRIGNLTPLSAPINRRLTNETFGKKKPEFKKSDLLITKDLAKRKTWSPKAIAERQAELAKDVHKIWPLPRVG